MVKESNIKLGHDQSREKNNRILEWVREPRDWTELAECVQSVFKARGEIKLRLCDHYSC